MVYYLSHKSLICMLSHHSPLHVRTAVRQPDKPCNQIFPKQEGFPLRMSCTRGARSLRAFPCSSSNRRERLETPCISGCVLHFRYSHRKTAAGKSSRALTHSLLSICGITHFRAPCYFLTDDITHAACFLFHKDCGGMQERNYPFAQSLLKNQTGFDAGKPPIP